MRTIGIYVKRLALIVMFVTLYSIVTLAQAPSAFKYMAIARNIDGKVIANQQIGVQVSILQDSMGGEAIFSETFTKTTNDYGLINLEIGNGSAVLGSLETIDWQSGNYFIEIGLDINGGTSYVSMGASQILSIPYALYAETAGNTFSGNYNDLTNLPSFDGWDTDTTDDFSCDVVVIYYTYLRCAGQSHFLFFLKN